MSNLGPDQKRFITSVASHTGLDPRVVGAWVVAEEGYRNRPVGHNDHNWLNIGNTDNKWYGGGNTWADPEKAAKYTADWIAGKYKVPGFGKAAPGIQAILKTAGQGPHAQIQAIANSGWASSGYNGGKDLSALYHQLQGLSGAANPAPATAATSVSATDEAATPQGPDIYSVISGLQAQQAKDNPLDTQDAGIGSVALPDQATNLQNVMKALSPPTQASIPTAQAASTPVASAASAGGANSGASGGGADRRAAWATAKVGSYAESQGKNLGPSLNTLEHRFGMKGAPWCAMFATTAATHGGASSKTRTASVADIRSWGNAGANGYHKGLIRGDRSQVGDLIMWGNDHVAFVVGRDSHGNILTIQGNGSAGHVDRRTVSAAEAKGLRSARPRY